MCNEEVRKSHLQTDWLFDDTKPVTQKIRGTHKLRIIPRSLFALHRLCIIHLIPRLLLSLHASSATSASGPAPFDHCSPTRQSINSADLSKTERLSDN